MERPSLAVGEPQLSLCWRGSLPPQTPPMIEFERMRKAMAFHHVQTKGDAVTRDLMESLRDERAEAVHENRSLANEVSRLRNDLIDAHRGGLTPAARQVVGRGVWALVAVSGVAGLLLWIVGVAPVGRALRRSIVAEAPPVRTGASGAAQTMTFAALGPPELVHAVASRFSIMPKQIDTAGHRLSVRFVDGPYSRMGGGGQFAHAMAIAKFVWRHPARPRDIDTITVRIEQPMRVAGERAVMEDYYFYPEQLNNP